MGFITGATGAVTFFAGGALALPMEEVEAEGQVGQRVHVSERRRGGCGGRCPAKYTKYRYSPSRAVAVRKDDVSAAIHAAVANVAGLGSISGGGGLIQTTSG